MAKIDEPLVSVVTPVYNGDAYLAECIESVLAQTYSNWEYVIVNNASTDRTLEIAQSYAQKDKRIRIHTNETLLPIIANHNHAFRLISPEAKYCKVVSADDWLLPQCLTQMVELAESDPSIGIVSAYQLSGGGETWYVRNYGLPFNDTVVDGASVCRAHLIGRISVLGNPTSVLYRADLVRDAERFYPNESAEADRSACFVILQNSKMGFIHQVLSYERIHEVRQTTKSADLNAYLPSNLSDLQEYGRFCLSDEEFDATQRDMIAKYYEFLGKSALEFRDKKFWNYHKTRLADLGHPLDWKRLSAAVGKWVAIIVFNPQKTISKAINRISAPG